HELRLHLLERRRIELAALHGAVDVGEGRVQPLALRGREVGRELGDDLRLQLAEPPADKVLGLDDEDHRQGPQEEEEDAAAEEDRLAAAAPSGPRAGGPGVAGVGRALRALIAAAGIGHGGSTGGTGLPEVYNDHRAVRSPAPETEAPEPDPRALLLLGHPPAPALDLAAPPSPPPGRRGRG